MAAVEVLKKLGCEVRDVELPHTPYAVAALSSRRRKPVRIWRYDGVRYTTRSASASTLSDMYRMTREEGF